jgi:hypothetical protein
LIVFDQEALLQDNAWLASFGVVRLTANYPTWYAGVVCDLRVLFAPFEIAGSARALKVRLCLFSWLVAGTAVTI